jgi:ubiquinone biosynthesis protein Coq4
MFTSSHSHRNQIHYLDTLKGIATMLRNPEATESVFDIEDGLSDIEATRLAMLHVRKDPDMAAMIDERYLRTKEHDLDALLQLPANTLGYAFARNLTDKGFDPDYFRKREIKNDIDYVLMRLRQTHDIWHVITGFDTDPVGELGVKAVEVAQTRRPMAAVVSCGGVMRFLLHDPENLGKVLAAVSAGYQMGIKSKLLLAQRWEDHWDRPLDEWRAMLNLTPVTSLTPKEW